MAIFVLVNPKEKYYEFQHKFFNIFLIFKQALTMLCIFIYVNFYIVYK